MLTGTIYQDTPDIGIILSGFTEKSLTVNRIDVSDVCDDNNNNYPYHRYSYGTFW